jgi:DNA-binding MarR family transcriptional regulator
MVVTSGASPESGDNASFRLPQTDLGTALRIAWWSYVRRVDIEMEAAGFPERSNSMNYVFALYAQPGPISISEMGRLFDISRQAASKVVAELRRRGYVKATPSAVDQREKVVELTDKAIDFVTERLRAATKLDQVIRARLGEAGIHQLTDALGAVAELSTDKGDFDPANLYRSPKLW